MVLILRGLLSIFLALVCSLSANALECFQIGGEEIKPRPNAKIQKLEKADLPIRLQSMLSPYLTRQYLKAALEHFRKMVTDAGLAASQVLQTYGATLIADYNQLSKSWETKFPELGVQKFVTVLPRTNALHVEGVDLRVNPKDTEKAGPISLGEYEILLLREELKALLAKTPDSWLSNATAVLEAPLLEANALAIQSNFAQIRDPQTWASQVQMAANDLRDRLGRTVILPGFPLSRFPQFSDPKLKALNGKFTLPNLVKEQGPGVTKISLEGIDAYSDANENRFYLMREPKNPEAPEDVFFHGALTSNSQLGSLVSSVLIFGGGIAVDSSLFGPARYATKLSEVAPTFNRNGAIRFRHDSNRIRIANLRSWSSTEGFWTALDAHLRKTETLFDFFVAQSFSDPFTAEAQVERIRWKYENGVIDNYIPAWGDLLVKISKEMSPKLVQMRDGGKLEDFGDLILFLQGDADVDGGPMATATLEHRRRHFAPRSRQVIFENPILRRAREKFGNGSPNYLKVFMTLSLLDPSLVEAGHFLVSTRDIVSVETLSAELLKKGLPPEILRQLDLNESHASQNALTTKQVKLARWAMQDDILANPSAAPAVRRSRERLQAKLLRLGTSSFFEYGLQEQGLSLDAIKDADPTDPTSLIGRARKMQILRDSWVKERQEEEKQLRERAANKP